MTESGGNQEPLGELFERITGQSTVQEKQQVDVSVRLSETSEDSDVSTFVDASVKATGLDEAIDAPNRS